MNRRVVTRLTSDEVGIAVNSRLQTPFIPRELTLLPVTFLSTYIRRASLLYEQYSEAQCSEARPELRLTRDELHMTVQLSTAELSD